jgi:hypothetical protein
LALSGTASLQLGYLLLSLLKRHVLDQHRLSHQVKGIGPIADSGADELFRFGVLRWRWRLGYSVRQIGQHVTFFWGHGLDPSFKGDVVKREFVLGSYREQEESSVPGSGTPAF